MPTLLNPVFCKIRNDPMLSLATRSVMGRTDTSSSSSARARLAIPAPVRPVYPVGHFRRSLENEASDGTDQPVVIGDRPVRGVGWTHYPGHVGVESDSIVRIFVVNAAIWTDAGYRICPKMASRSESATGRSPTVGITEDSSAIGHPLPVGYPPDRPGYAGANIT